MKGNDVIMMLPQFYVDDIIKRAVTEDIPYIDLATDLLINEEQTGKATFLAKQEGVVCGIDIAIRAIRLLDGDAVYEILKKDGEWVNKGDIIATVTAKTACLLKAERTALNLLQHMSGVATATRRVVDAAAKGGKVHIADTRKTTPTLRALEKYAVMTGGGHNHRFCLSDAAMIKDNHVDAVGSLKKAVAVLREKLGHTVKIEVEARNFDELNEAIESGADIIMLDNMSCEDMAKAVKLVNGRAKTEASGNVTLENVAAVAATGVDIISLGAITHSVMAMDISMKIK